VRTPAGDHWQDARTVLTSRNAVLLLALVLIGLVFQWLTRNAHNPFLSARSLSTVFTQASVIGVLACGMTFVIVLTHIDLSVGSALAFLGGMAAWMMGPRAADLDPAVAGMVPTGLGWSAGLTIVAVLVVGMLLWGLKGVLQVWTGMPAFIITLGGMMGYRGLALLMVERERPITRGTLVDTIGTGYLDVNLGWVVLGVIAVFGMAQTWAARQQQNRVWYLAGMPSWLLAGVVLFLQLPHEGVQPRARGIAYLTCLWAAAALVMAYLASATVFGRHLYAAGGNAEAAVLCGVRVKRVTIIAMAVMGALTALAALMQVGQEGSAVSGAGELAELDAIAACVIGGVSLQGGRGSISGAVLGATIMQALTAGLQQCYVDNGYQYIIKATVLVAIVAVDHLMRRD
jgi:D-xylose transport system permease protein